MSEESTHFGYKTIPAKDKASYVAGVFDSVANKYDIMNDIMSGGVHRIWKHITVEISRVKPGQKVLDVAGGTGDLAAKFAKRVGPSGHVVLSDINQSMLDIGRDRLIDKGLVKNISYVLADAQMLPFQDDSFDIVSIGFGLRNVTDKDRALISMRRVLRPGGKLLILEFSKPYSDIISKLYDEYSFKIIPKLGKLFANDEGSYKYLAESIRVHPDQETLKQMVQKAGLLNVEYINMSGGIAAVHMGIKP
ncbi:MAG: bifunctional demethylmenaquinone methyltransferase/2-methoxy-6-polyprenyl-1,4-benzoquinol methylase UbiE [Porticoccaceae bacterium]|nr:bifunctional demethylmenaquinone methyltransferase/2-methoxy-6-polyprenyl-1,4-benzoquinol methylase UbiE [Porticoccaceae bacterium]